MDKTTSFMRNKVVEMVTYFGIRACSREAMGVGEEGEREIAVNELPTTISPGSVIEVLFHVIDNPLPVAIFGGQDIGSFGIILQHILVAQANMCRFRIVEVHF